MVAWGAAPYIFTGAEPSEEGSSGTHSWASRLGVWEAAGVGTSAGALSARYLSQVPLPGRGRLWACLCPSFLGAGYWGHGKLAHSNSPEIPKDRQGKAGGLGDTEPGRAAGVCSAAWVVHPIVPFPAFSPQSLAVVPPLP